MDENLTKAIRNGERDEVKKLANASNVALVDVLSKQTPLHIAAIRGDNEIVEILTDCGNVDIDATDEHGRTPLYFAASAKSEKTVKYLIGHRKARAAKAKCTCCGMTALERAAELGHIQTVTALATAPGMKNANVEQAIRLAKRNGHVNVQSFLNGHAQAMSTKQEMEEQCWFRLREHVDRKGFTHNFSHELLKKYAEKAAIHALEVNGMGCGSEVAAELGVVAVYDLAILIDDSSSMVFGDHRQRIPALKKGLKVVADMYAKIAYADDGVTPRGILAARFLNRQNAGGNDAPRADDLTALALQEQILQPLVYRKLREGNMKRPLLVMVITDGKIEHEEPNVLENNMNDCINKLRDLGRINWVVFQFTRIGTDQGAEIFLDRLSRHKQIGPYVSVSIGDYDVHSFIEDRSVQRFEKMRRILNGAISKDIMPDTDGEDDREGDD